MTNIIEVENKIITLRDQQVILSNHVADLYGVETREVNQAVKNNPEKFPDGYIIELDKQEKEEVVKIFDNLGNLLYSPSNPKAFTEKGLYMLATILKSPKAVETTIAIVESYAKLRELSRVMVEIPQYEDDKVAQQSLVQRGGQLVGDLLADVLPARSSETSVELNFGMLKLKHTVKREGDDEIAQRRQEVAELKRVIAESGMSEFAKEQPSY